MPEEDLGATLERLLIPIKTLYAEITERGNRFCYPFIYSDTDGDYLAYISRLIEDYIQRVSQIDYHSVELLNHSFDTLPSECKPPKDFDFVRDVKALSKLVIDVLNDCYRCYPDDAFQKLKLFFEADNLYYLNMLPQLEVKKWSLFRIRTGVFDKTQDGEVFHIPFEKRHLVATQRFSIPGYPILYLAGSLFTAWCEMDKPELEGMTFAEFKFKEKEVFVDLSYPYSKDINLWEYYSLFVMYPLLMACMVRVKCPNAPFKPEYIMPQLMTKLVREHGSQFRGIAYMSNKLPDNSSLHSVEARCLAVCTNNCICIKGHDANLAAKMQMKDMHTITSDESRMAISHKKKYEIDFKMLQSLENGPFRDINVVMERGG